jgi:hypothetical protein
MPTYLVTDRQTSLLTQLNNAISILSTMSLVHEIPAKPSIKRYVPTSKIAEANSLATLAWDAHSELNEAIVEAAGLANPTEAKPALTAETKANLEILRHVLVDRVQDCTAFAQRLGDEWRNEWNEKSERWQEGENGSKAEDFISEWENFEPDVEELDWNDLAEIDPGPIEDFEALPESA